LYSEIALSTYSKNKFISEIEKKEKEVCAGFAGVPQTTQVFNQCLVKMEKALNLWLEDMNRKSMPDL
jgi:hypothetical protein